MLQKTPPLEEVTRITLSQFHQRGDGLIFAKVHLQGERFILSKRGRPWVAIIPVYELRGATKAEKEKAREVLQIGSAGRTKKQPTEAQE